MTDISLAFTVCHGEWNFMKCFWFVTYNEQYIIVTIFLHGLASLTCFGINALPSFSGASTISFSWRLVVVDVFRESSVIQSFKMVNPILFEFGAHFLYSINL
jgi:hypothetical protein